jgi:hypothetical protein
MNFLKIFTSLIKGKNAVESASTACRLASGVLASMDANTTGKDDIAATALDACADVLDSLQSSDSNTIGKALDAAIAGLQTARAGLTSNEVCK